MMQLLMIADDFTGALDAGVQFAARGAKTTVVTNILTDWDTRVGDEDVLVLDAETRHLSAAEAYEIVYRIVKKAAVLKVPHIYKKVDSALRGNIGAELSALLHASGRKQLPFLPAFPQIGRKTINGIHYIQDIPVAESVFGMDPFEPVVESCVSTLVSAQTQDDITMVPIASADTALPRADGILIFDAATETDLQNAGQRLARGNQVSILAGCAGFAALLPDLLEIGKKAWKPQLPKLDPRLFVLCGSVNPITCQQLAYAENHGFWRLRLEPQQKLDSGYWKSNEGHRRMAQLIGEITNDTHIIIDSNDPGGNEPTSAYAARKGMTLTQVRKSVSNALGQILQNIDEAQIPGTLLVTGGDTLKQCMECLNIHELEPLCEMEAGVVLSRFRHSGLTRYVISKSGGFGEENLLVQLTDRLNGQRKKKMEEHL